MTTVARIELDHLAVAGETLAEAQAHVEEAVGVSLQPGGQHDVFFTHNALLGLEEGLYLEAIAVDPEAPSPDRPRWFDLDRFSGAPRLTNWICRSEDLAAVLEQSRLDFGSPVDLRRGALQWQMAVPQSGILPFGNRAPALIQWQAGGHPAAQLRPSGIRLRRLTVGHPEAAALAAELDPLMRDPRVVMETGPIGYHAVFDTPNGQRTLEG